ncbi:hypothetical protein MXM82_17525 [Pseudomonas asiatica]|uniref:hypothetical protein n=1 Tax=Pseudomonas asiatica TaxID=2219225 RepID=UPI002DB68538|nr:hypothetical protein [Pseudomonas asiatica]MEB6590908.1 hypothetical protein [Pseudomonas asiatica]
MKKLHFRIFFIGCLSVAALCARAGEGTNSLSYDTVESLYHAGKCKVPKSEIGLTHRQVSLLFLGDVLSGISQQNSYTSDIVGDFKVFKVGRNVNSTFEKIYYYSRRNDVRSLVKDDARRFNSEAEKIAKNISPRAGLYIVCQLYFMLSNKEFDFRGELESYSDALNAEILNKNMNDLQRQLESYGLEQ